MKKVMLSAAACAMAFSVNAGVADDVVIAEAIQSKPFDSVYAGVGIGGSFLKGDDIPYAKDTTKLKIADWKGELETKANRFTGSFVIGGGKVFNNKIYAGAEFLMDFTKNKKFDVENTNTAGVKVVTKWDADHTGVESVDDLVDGKIEGKIGGFIPQINAKVGYAFNNCTLAYAKLGCAWTKMSVDTYEGSQAEPAVYNVPVASESKTKAAFVLGLGAEKAFCKKFSTAIEGDYNFGWKHRGLKFNKGWSIRALAKYNVKY